MGLGFRTSKGLGLGLLAFTSFRPEVGLFGLECSGQGLLPRTRNPNITETRCTLHNWVLLENPLASLH